MVYREIVSEVKRLPLHEQFLLVEELLRGMRETAQPPTHKARKRIVPFQQLRGALRPEGPLPTDAELKDLRENVEKSTGEQLEIFSDDAGQGAAQNAAFRWVEIYSAQRLAKLVSTLEKSGFTTDHYEAGDKPEPLLELSKWCASNQLYTQAEDELERLLVLAPDNEVAKKALERIRSRKH